MFVHSRSNMFPHYNLLSYPKQTKKHSKMSVHSRSNMSPHYTLGHPLSKKLTIKATHVFIAKHIFINLIKLHDVSDFDFPMPHNYKIDIDGL